MAGEHTPIDPITVAEDWSGEHQRRGVDATCRIWRTNLRGPPAQLAPTRLYTCGMGDHPTYQLTPVNNGQDFMLTRHDLYGHHRPPTWYPQPQQGIWVCHYAENRDGLPAVMVLVNAQPGVVLRTEVVDAANRAITELSHTLREDGTPPPKPPPPADPLQYRPTA